MYVVDVPEQPLGQAEVKSADSVAMNSTWGGGIVISTSKIALFSKVNLNVILTVCSESLLL